MWLAMATSPNSGSRQFGKTPRARSAQLARAPDRWLLQSTHSLVTWAWWAEGATQSPLATSPGPIWRVAAGRLDPQDPATWSLWSRYPEALPENVRREISEHDIAVRSTRCGMVIGLRAPPYRNEICYRQGTNNCGTCLWIPLMGSSIFRDWSGRDPRDCAPRTRLIRASVSGLRCGSSKQALEKPPGFF